MSHSDSEDIQIIDRVLSGDVDAFSGIIEKYKDKTFNYVYSQVKDYDEALDITQEIFIMTIEALRSFRRESKFSTWFYSIMVNYCKNYRKKNSRYNVVSINSSRGDEEYDLQIPDDRENPEKEVILNDSLRIVREEIGLLPDDYREILVLRDIEGMSYNEISEILGISLSNVKVRIHRGREFLKNRLLTRGLI
ncbi:MAG TPA: sigma-70 family RNA polymerase sigma factor [Spirochaetota bacterium]|nr:sigma-70 family RNA polymerase sigma factor [Spirochaetota bacterium]HPC41703.1 sigma-70 family RNA polymerase sigma factor [Spirochaetota bacterium]HPL15647.1 sigma-70 family RNA polymerase sigma factor [Spirochaetota bacterium]HQF09272.1 sigma-70 family RNA polymerase sigma factor [Spirochaetota bacterium]HQH98220.1 sigma-70 family RNA polymerase sigma factor [Spirochaetota bacterium]